MNNIELGRYGEQVAKHHLIGGGYRILAENFTCKSGEIDIIAQKGGYIIFVEVKTRRTLSYGYPGQAVDRRKQIRYGKIASTYIRQNRIFNKSYRFDVIEIYIKDKGSHTINHIENAFTLTNKGYYM
ncbi:MAG: YraN family protein [Clostridiales bacterium]|nr:YraN family protein [Clostridiales bacterium]